LSKIYTSIDAFEAAQEEEFRAKVEEIAYYQGNIERTTLDGEWTESELKDDLWDEANKILNGTNGHDGWVAKHSGRIFRDSDLLLPEFVVNNICDRFDLVEVYNRAYDLHRNDKPMKFGIHYFDELARAEINKVLKENLMT